MSERALPPPGAPTTAVGGAEAHGSPAGVLEAVHRLIELLHRLHVLIIHVLLLILKAIIMMMRADIIMTFSSTER